MPRTHRSRSCGDGSAEGIPGQCPVSEVRMSSGRPCSLLRSAAPLVMPGLVPGIPLSQTSGTPSKHVDGRDKPGHDVSEGTSSTHTNFSIRTPGAVPLDAPDHGALHGARSFRQDCDMRRSWFRARICASCPRARGRSFCRARIRVSRSRARIRLTQRKSERRATAGGMSGRERPDSARTTLSGAPATIQARGTRACKTRYSARTTLRACATCPVESHLSRLIPLNPGESRLKKSLCFMRDARGAA